MQEGARQPQHEVEGHGGAREAGVDVRPQVEVVEGEDGAEVCLEQ